MGGLFHVFSKVVHVASGGIVRTKDVEKVAAPVITAAAVVASAGTLAPALVTAGMSTIVAGATAGAISAGVVPAVLNNTDISLENTILGGVTGGACAGINIPNAPLASKIAAASVGHVTNSIVTGSDPTKNIVKTFICEALLPNNKIAGSLVVAAVDGDINSGLSNYVCIQTGQYIEALKIQSDELNKIKNNIDAVGPANFVESLSRNKAENTQIKEMLDMSGDLYKITQDKIKYEKTIDDKSLQFRNDLGMLKVYDELHNKLLDDIKSKIVITDNNINVRNSYCVMNDNLCVTTNTDGDIGVATKKIRVEVG